MNTQAQTHLAKALSEVEALFTKVVSRIEALQPGDRLPASKLAEELANERGTTKTAILPVIQLLMTNYPGVKHQVGRFGGYVKLPIENTQASDQ